MKLVVLGVLAILSGCLSIAGRAGMAGPLDGAPYRGLNGAFELGTFVGTRRVAINPTIAFDGGPLGSKSEHLAELGGRVYYSHPGWPVSQYVRIASADRDSCQEAPCGETFNLSAGVAILGTSTDLALVDGMLTGIAAASVGLAYHHQQQDGIGDGHFLGVELAVVLGMDYFAGVRGAIKKHEDERR